jgi:phosphoribosylformylglycinamidine cyclo-ligase
VDEHVLARVFNCAFGLVLVVAQALAAAVAATLRAQGETVHVLGAIEPQAPEGVQTLVD